MDTTQPTAAEALVRLREGNERFASGTPRRPGPDEVRRRALVEAQQPVALVLGCADSRVPPEIVFDQGLGDLLVARTAGHVLDGAVVGTIEFGVRSLRIPLVVVLGHEGCAAVAATVDALRREGGPEEHLAGIVDAIAPSLQADDPVDVAVDRHVAATVDRLRRRPVLEAAGGDVLVVGARYGLGSGRVTFTS